MLFVIIESPFAGDVAGNRLYGQQCLKNALLRGEAPFARHLLYTQALDDTVPAEREAGILADLAVMTRADRVAVYVDRGISSGMRRGIDEANRLGIRVTYRSERHPEADFNSPITALAVS